MQDNASPHAAKYTKQILHEAGVSVIFWPAYSPDLNPIESLWDLLKDWIAENYIMEDLKKYEVIREAVHRGWLAIRKDQLDHLIDSMPARCEAVIVANGKETKY